MSVRDGSDRVFGAQAYDARRGEVPAPHLDGFGTNGVFVVRDPACKSRRYVTADADATVEVCR